MPERNSRVAYVDLTTGSIQVKDLDSELSRKFLGGGGVSLRLAQDLIKPGMEPLSPESPIIIGAGALAGTKAQAPRWTVVSKWPLNGCVAFSSGGMGFGVKLKRAGYDQIVIVGQSQKPVYLKVDNDSIEVCDASELWGQDILDTTDALWHRLGKEFSILAIGQAGENLVRISVALVDKTSSLGKGGLPAIMGSKKLKAIAVKGTGKVSIADQERFDKACTELVGRYKADPKLREGVKLGRLFDYTDDFRIAYRNSREVFPHDKYWGLYRTEIYRNDIRDKALGCTTCGYPCKDSLRVKKGDYEGYSTIVSSTVGRIWNLGIQTAGGCTFGQLVKLIDVANRYGVDTHQFAPVIMLAMELYELGIITKEDTGGLALKSDFETTLSLLDQIAFRKGLGDLLADGTPRIIREFGSQCEQYSTHIKGSEQQMDARATDFNVAVFSQVTNPEGGGSLETGRPLLFLYPSRQTFSLDMVKKFCQKMELSDEAMGRIFNKESGYFNVPRLTRYAEDLHVMVNALGICDYRIGYIDLNILSDLYSSVTGIETTPNDMKLAAERIWNLFKLLNVREGFERKDDRFPPRWLEPWTESGKAVPVITCTGEPVSADTFGKWLDDYYDERGWDIKRGVPAKDKLVALGLNHPS
jgi:aldehyde:ferredoxin oxidoreductase